MIAGVYEALKGEKKKEETGSQKDGAVQSQIEARNLIRGKNESRTRSMQSKYRGIEKAPDQDLQVSGGQFQGKSQSAIQESLILWKAESGRSKLQFDTK